jgi:hypothetical protein
MFACVFHQGGGERGGYATRVWSERFRVVVVVVVDLKVLGEHLRIQVGCNLACTFFGSERDMTVDA